MNRLVLASLVIAGTVLVPIAEAASVSPSALYLSNRSRSASLTLTNTGSQPEEVRISFAFGYPQSDEKGQVDVPLQTEGVTDSASAVAWLRAFPRRLVLEPGAKQVVRIMAQPPAGLAAGEYWARILVSSRGGQPPIEQRQGNIGIQLNLETVIVTAVSYRQGDVNTGVSVRSASATATDDGLEVTLDMERSGNAAYLGRINFELVDDQGKTLSTWQEDVAVYRTLTRVMKHPLDGTIPQNAKLRYVFETTRPDLPVGGPISAPEVEGVVPVRF